MIDFQVTKVLFNFKNSSTVPHVATGVEFGTSDRTGERMTAFARKEVILAAGSIHVSDEFRSSRPISHFDVLVRLPHFFSSLVLAIPTSSGLLESLPLSI